MDSQGPDFWRVAADNELDSLLFNLLSDDEEEEFDLNHSGSCSARSWRLSEEENDMLRNCLKTTSLRNRLTPTTSLNVVTGYVKTFLTTSLPPASQNTSFFHGEKTARAGMDFQLYKSNCGYESAGIRMLS